MKTSPDEQLPDTSSNLLTSGHAPAGGCANLVRFFLEKGLANARLAIVFTDSSLIPPASMLKNLLVNPENRFAYFCYWPTRLMPI